MGWAPLIGRLFGIEIRVHITFLVLLAFLGLAHWLPERSLSAAFIGVSFFALLFLCVVLHELGHALAARQFGIKTQDITLLPIGGVARLERMPEKPTQNFGGDCRAVGQRRDRCRSFPRLALLRSLAAARRTLRHRWQCRGTASLRECLLVVFNLLPAFPMDGGRVLRAFLAMGMPFAEATRVAARIGQGMAVLFGFAGLFINPMLILIALFVWVGAEQEATAAEMKSIALPASR